MAGETHVTALDRHQVEALIGGFREMLDVPDLKTLYLVATTDPEVQQSFETTQFPQVVPDKVFVGKVFTLAVGYELDEHALSQMGLVET